MARGKPFQPGHPKMGGKKKGCRHGKSKELKQFLSDLRASEEYQESAKRRVLAGKAPHIESLMVRDELGEPTQKHKVDAELTIRWQQS